MDHKRQPVRTEQIIAGLARVGLRCGDTVLVHSSLSAFGHVAGGAGSVIEALCEAVGPTGTLVLPTFCWDSFHGKDTITFDPQNTPSETGYITEVFRRRPGVMRSEHITHSVAALGLNQAAVMGEGISPWGPGSTFDALYRLDAWNLFMGVGFNVCTALHAAEERAVVPYREFRPFRNSTIVLPDGTTKPSRAIEFGRKPGYGCDFARMEGHFASRELFHETRIGEARVINIRIRTVIDEGVALLQDDNEALLA